MKSKRKALKGLAKDKIVDISDFRKLQSQKSMLRVGFITQDESLIEALKEKSDEKFELAVFDGRFAFEQKLKKDAFDALLIDERVAETDAIGLCEKLKRQLSLDELVVFILSNDKAKEKVREGLEKGCDEWVTRLDDPAGLVRLIEHYLSL